MNKRILIVDDSSLSRRTLRNMLEGAGYNVEEASDGAQALERYFLNPHDLILLDNVMERLSGLEVLAKFRELNPDVRIVMATADIQSSTRDQAREAGAVGIINKPFTKDRLLATITTVLNGGTVWN
jgi:two-component system chemotaxis response regulator CheY